MAVFGFFKILMYFYIINSLLSFSCVCRHLNKKEYSLIVLNLNLTKNRNVWSTMTLTYSRFFTCVLSRLWNYMGINSMYWNYSYRFRSFVFSVTKSHSYIVIYSLKIPLQYGSRFWNKFLGYEYSPVLNDNFPGFGIIGKYLVMVYQF